MANELQQTLTRIINKSNILVEKYHALEARATISTLVRDIDKCIAQLNE